MDPKLKEILSQFEEKKQLFENFANSSFALLNSLLALHTINPHQISFRVKDRTSLEKKIITKNFKYKDIEEITDIVGLRIITYFEDEIDIIAKIIEKEFLIDKQNSVDKRNLESDKFGYRSLHFVVSYKKERLKLAEYASFANLKIEIQVRSILQHSWAEIEHDLGYKGEHEIPFSARRTFYRVAALLEQADIEFVKLKNTIQEYESKIQKKVLEHPSTVKIDKASLFSFVTKNPTVIRIEDKLAEFLPDKFISEPESDLINEYLLNRIRRLNLNSIDEIEKLYLEYEVAFIEDQRNDFLQDNVSGFVRGASIIWLIDFITSQK